MSILSAEAMSLEKYSRLSISPCPCIGHVRKDTRLSSIFDLSRGEPGDEANDSVG